MFFLALYRNQKFTSGLAVLSTFVLGTAVAMAQHAPQSVVFRTSLGMDLDGDRIPETATVKQRGSFYQVSIHFSTGRPRLKLRTFVGDDVAGLTLEVTDVNTDSEAEIVLTSATSIRPVAVWLNRGSATFQRVNLRSYRLVGRYTGPRLKQQARIHRDSIGRLSNHRLRQAELEISFKPCCGLQSIAGSESNPLTFDSWLAQAALRGPPFSPHV